ncbi:MAG: hypothetical protein WC492_01085 [Candidatus Micrarchaeia archaeon]
MADRHQPIQKQDFTNETQTGNYMNPGILDMKKYADTDISMLISFLASNKSKYGSAWLDIKDIQCIVFGPIAVQEAMKTGSEKRKKVSGPADLNLNFETDKIAKKAKEMKAISLVACVPCEDIELYQLNIEIEKEMNKQLGKKLLGVDVSTKTVLITPQILAEYMAPGEEEQIKAIFANAKVKKSDGTYEDFLASEYAGEFGFEQVLKAKTFSKLFGALRNMQQIPMSFPNHSELIFFTKICDRIREVRIVSKNQQGKAKNIEERLEALNKKNVEANLADGTRIWGEATFDKKSGRIKIGENYADSYLKQKGDRVQITSKAGLELTILRCTSRGLGEKVGEKISKKEKISLHEIIDPSLSNEKEMQEVFANKDEIYDILTRNGSKISIGSGRTGLEKNNPLNINNYFEALMQDYSAGKKRPEFDSKAILLFTDMAYTDVQGIIRSQNIGRINKFLKESKIKLFVIAVAPQKCYDYRYVTLENQKENRNPIPEMYNGQKRYYLPTEGQFSILARGIVGAGEYDRSKNQDNTEEYAYGTNGSIVWLKYPIGNEKTLDRILDELLEVVSLIKVFKEK